MRATENQALPEKPSLMAALMAGFDAITNHLELILFPLALDLFLWLGPHLKLNNLVRQIVGQLDTLPGVDTPEVTQALELNRELWLLVAERLNLFSALRAYPVGITSLMASRQPVINPLGSPAALEVTSITNAAAWWLGLTILGLVGGTLYFTLVAQASIEGKVHWRGVLGTLPWNALQVIYLSIFLYALIFALGIPGSCLISVASLGGLQVAQFSILLLAALALWILFPLFLSAHGIFAFHNKMWTSVRQGARLTRMTLPQTSLLFLSIIVISEGLDTLWRIPAEDTWLSLVGVVAHAFVTTGLLAASFVYYRDASRWLQRLIQQTMLVESRNLRGHIP